MSFETDWHEKKASVEAIIEELLGLGVSLETAKVLSNWNPTLDFDSYSDLGYPQSLTAVAPPEATRDRLRIRFSRAGTRINSGLLDGAVLDAGKLYAVYVPDVDELNITSVRYYLNGSFVHAEASDPWDYDGTAFDGTANRVTFSAGDYIIRADITDKDGSFSIEAGFSVEA